MSATDQFGRTRHVEHCMGTVFSFDLPGDLPADALQEALGFLHRADETFSTYRRDSAIRRLDRGELDLDQCPAEVGEVLQLCEQIRAETGGYFTIRPSGVLDPSGLVKGWAIERAGRILVDAGSTGHAIGGGGDLQFHGRPGPAEEWTAGIVDPRRPSELLAVVTGTDFAVATSGSSERGHHIQNPVTGTSADELIAVTLVGPSLTTVDAYATAAFAMGPRAREWLRSRPDLQSLAVTSDGSIWTTGSIRSGQRSPVPSHTALEPESPAR